MIVYPPMHIRILGCGASGGVPLITGEWGQCDPENPKNRRMRTSALFQIDGLNILIDTSPDLRQQLLNANVDRIDAVLLTHIHSDHTMGLDELRQVYFKHRKPIPIYADAHSMEHIQQRFSYMFSSSDSFYPTFLEAHPIEDDTFTISHIPIRMFEQLHGHQRSSGFRIGNVAYSTDVKDFPEASQKYLEGLDLWFVDCLRDEPHSTHAHTDLTLSWIEKFKPKQSVLIHLSEHLDYENLLNRVPVNVHVAYDGMELQV